MSGQWKDSSRGSELTSLFYRMRPLVLARDRHECQWVDPLVVKDYSTHVHVHVSEEIQIASITICGEYATDVDHINGHDDDMGNLQSLCSYHHDKKSSKQGNDARWQHSSKRTSERHSGIKQGDVSDE